MRVDFSAEAVQQACEDVWRLGRAGGASAWGDLAATGLGDGWVDVVLCVDALQFSRQPGAACCELPRVLGPGGRAVLTCWEPFGQGGERLPGRMARVDLAARLTAVGSATWKCETASAGRPVSGPCGRRPQRPAPATALRCSHSTTKGMRSLEILDLTRWVIATAAATVDAHSMS